jgi:hypothetical protein
VGYAVDDVESAVLQFAAATMPRSGMIWIPGGEGSPTLESYL